MRSTASAHRLPYGKEMVETQAALEIAETDRVGRHGSALKTARSTRTIRFASAVCVLAVLGTMASSARSQESFGDAAAIIQFQRSVDSYAFQHRQVQRRLGAAADQKGMAAAMRAARPSAAGGDFFTQVIAAAFHARISTALRTQGCKTPTGDSPSNEVPRVGALAISMHLVPGCLLEVLPRLPEELEYRATGVVLVLVDTHANTVVDVLHGAFSPPRD